MPLGISDRNSTLSSKSLARVAKVTSEKLKLMKREEMLSVSTNTVDRGIPVGKA